MHEVNSMSNIYVIDTTIIYVVTTSNFYVIITSITYVIVIPIRYFHLNVGEMIKLATRFSSIAIFY